MDYSFLLIFFKKSQWNTEGIRENSEINIHNYTARKNSRSMVFNEGGADDVIMEVNSEDYKEQEAHHH